MKLSVVILCIFFSLNCLAQDWHSRYHNQFEKLIYDPKVEWAGYIDDTISFVKNNLNNLLVNRFSKREIKATLPLLQGSNDLNHLFFQGKDVIDQNVLYPIHKTGIMFDSMGNLIKSELKIKPHEIHTKEKTITDITQILFVKNGEILTYIPWAMPRNISIKTSSGVELGYANYFATCFNFNYNKKVGKSDKTIFLGEFEKIISIDSFDVSSKLKELYGDNLITTIWPYLLKNKYVLTNISTQKQIKVDDLNGSLIGISPIVVPVYDSLGNVVGEKIEGSINPYYFKKVTLNQSWHYNVSKNIIYNKINYITLFAYKWVKGERGKELYPILKITFK